MAASTSRGSSCAWTRSTACGACASRPRLPSMWTRPGPRARRDLPRVCPYLHLPVQSGSDRVLAAMRRGYTRQQYLDTVALLRAHVPALALTTDVIVGYPGETEGEFEETVRLVEEVAFDGVFVFMYS